MTDYKENLKNTQSWRDAVCFVVDEKLLNRECFSSGEVTKEIRDHRPDLRFSHWDVGQYMRDLYYNGAMTYAFEGKAVQVPRRTDGSSRTPAGAEVFVYGSDYDSAEVHNFEVEIPRAQVDLSVPYDEYGTQPQEGPQRTFKDEKVIATVQGDNRLAIPRAAFDAFMQKTGKRIAFGDKVHIRLDKNDMKVHVSLNQNSDAKAYDLTRDRGRVKFKPDMDPNWASGEKFTVEVTNKGLEIDLSKAI